MRRSIIMSVCALALVVSQSASAEWINRYPRVSSLPLQVYLEGYNLPTFATSPTDPAPSPDGKSVAFAARGWLWIMDIATREARRVTRGASIDARPTWSSDGQTIAFMRDSGRDTGLWLLDVASGRERVLVDTPTIELDPVFSPDGRSVYYSSAEAGDLDIWRIDLASGAKTRLTTAKGQEINPQPVTGGLVYVSEPTLLSDTVEMLSFADGSTKILRREGLSPQLRVSASPDGRSFALTPLAGDDRTQLLVSNPGGGETLRLASDATYPVTPAWGRDGIWYVQPDREERFRLYRVAVTGGPAEEVSPLYWTMGAPTARVTIRTRRDGAALPARLAVVDGAGHPAAPEIGNTTFDGQHGRISFYSPGATTVELPAGAIAITASHGLDKAVTTRRKLRAGETATIDIDLPKPAFDAAERGWFSGDLHSHLNYGGPFQLEPDDLVSAMRAEALDVSTPMLANLQTALTDVRFWGWQRTERPFVKVSQEVRSHFLGHIGVIGADAPHTPFFFGPGYPAAYERLDLSNSSPLRFARAHGGMNIYVHPVMARDPFPQDGPPAGIPLELVPDALAGEVDAIELACLWTDELGTAELWYRLLNLGLTIAPTGGSDTMHNLHRTMAVGSTRVYAKPDGPLAMSSFLDAVRAGRSFVTNGPMIDFTAGDAGPGAAIPGGRRIPFTIDAFTAAPADHVEILVNGRVVRSYGALEGIGRYAGEIDVPAGGWIAARIRGGAPAWPSQDSYQFAHSAPIWLGERGSRDPAASQAAASALLRWMDVADARLKQGYDGEPTAKLRARFAEGRARLMELAR